MTDDVYRPSPALDFQEFMRGAEERLNAQGYALFPIEYTIMPHAVVVPRGYPWPPLTKAQRREALLDKIDILDAQKQLAREALDALDREDEGT